MIPTLENIKKLQKKKLEVHKKISNSFIQSALANKTLSALKIIYYLAAKLQKEDINYNDSLNTISIDKDEMLEYTELKISDIKNNFKKMQETSISFINEEKDFEEYIVLIPRIKFHLGKRSKTIEIDIYTSIIKLIIDVTKQYTFIDTKELMRLKNKHSIRLLPLLHTINGYKVKQKTLTISELNALFDTKYTAYELERSLLLKVKNELDNNSKLTFEYEVNYEVVGAGRPKATTITLKPIYKTNYQATIFTNFEEQVTEPVKQIQKQSIQETINIDMFDLTKNIVDDLLVECGIAHHMNEELNQRFELKLYDVLEAFKKWVKENNKQFSDLEYSFKKYVKDGFDNGYWRV